MNSSSKEFGIARQQRKAKAARKAFTLVEVALSLAVVAFALVAVFSLIGFSLSSSHDTNVRQALTLSLDQTISTYQGQNYTNALALVQANTNYFYDSTGVLLPSSAGSFFKSAVVNVTPAGSATNYLSSLQLRMTWPNPRPTSTNITVFSVLNTQ